jgi:ribosomal protein S16
LNQGAWPTDTVLSLFKKAQVSLPNFILKEEAKKLNKQKFSSDKKEEVKAE